MPSRRAACLLPTALKRIAVEDLRTGVYVQELCGSWMEHPFWSTQFLLEYEDDLARLRASGIRQVWIDTARGLDVASAAATGETREQADLEVEAALNRVAAARPPVAPSGLMIALARQLGMSDAQISEAGLAGLLHDIGKARIPVAILNKPAQLNDDEFTTMRQLPRIGHEMLSGQPDVPPAVLDAVLHHHERVDGHGYPDSLPEASIAVLARMCATCDDYDAITSARVYKPAWSSIFAVAACSSRPSRSSSRRARSCASRRK